MISRYALLVIFAAAAACAQEEQTERGAALVAALKTALVQELTAGMEQGPANAINVCKEQAPAVASALSIDGVRIGRTSHRLRNPANVAPDWVVPVLESYLADKSNRAPASVHLADDREGYVEVLVMQPLCVACHGQSLDPAVAEQIRESYRDDKATGFEVGEVRGVVWAEYPIAATD
jgi:hypothetical protein